MSIELEKTRKEKREAKEKKEEKEKGNKGYSGNEQADTLAKLGTQQSTEVPEPHVPISQSVIKEEMKKWMET